MHITIAVVQFEIQQGMAAANLAKAERFIEEAATRGADIVVFPEDFVTGPLQESPELADGEGRYRQHFQRLAVSYGLDIVPGSIIEREGEQLYNTTYYIDKAGTSKGRYRKVNLWHSERGYITAGDDFTVCETAYGRVGLLICWDLMFPEAFRAMLQQDVQLVICPSYWCFEDAGAGLKHDANAEVKLVNALCVARAFENGIALVYANAAGAAGEDRLIGHSQIAVPFKGALRTLQHSHEEMFLQSIDSELLSSAEEVYTIRKDLQNRR